MELDYFDLKAPNGVGTVMPRSSVCHNCGSLYRYSPFVIITYGSEKRVYDNLCDQCLHEKEAEGRMKERELQKNLRRNSIDNYHDRKRRANRNLHKKELEGG